MDEDHRDLLRVRQWHRRETRPQVHFSLQLALLFEVIFSEALLVSFVKRALVRIVNVSNMQSAGTSVRQILGEDGERVPRARCASARGDAAELAAAQPVHIPGLLMNSTEQLAFINNHLAPALDAAGVQYT